MDTSYRALITICGIIICLGLANMEGGLGDSTLGESGVSSASQASPATTEMSAPTRIMSMIQWDATLTKDQLFAAWGEPETKEISTIDEKYIYRLIDYREVDARFDIKAPFVLLSATLSHGQPNAFVLYSNHKQPAATQSRNDVPILSAVKRKLTDFTFDSNLTYGQVEAKWGPPDEMLGFGVDYRIYYIGPNSGVCFRFTSHQPLNLVTANVGDRMLFPNISK